MHTYTYLAEIEIEFNSPGLGLPDDETEVAYPIVEIAYRYTAGSPAVMYQRNGDPGWPAEPAELEFISAKLIKGDGLAPTPQQVAQWAEDFTESDDGYQQLVDHAEDMRREQRYG